jgi:hypothetical protein
LLVWNHGLTSAEDHCSAKSSLPRWMDMMFFYKLQLRLAKAYAFNCPL